MTGFRRPLLALLALSALAAPACNDYPVHSLLDSFEVRVTKELSHNAPVKLDFLWVIDHSPSMCSEQRDLAKGFKAFIESLQKLGQIDAQMAVVTVQQLPDADLSIVKKPGQFVHKAATQFPPNCIERVRMPCSADGHCAKPVPYGFSNFDGASSMCPAGGTTTPEALQAADWRCKSTSAAQYIANDNCSINSYCWAHCKNDQECHKLFPGQEGKVICYSPGGDPTFSQAGCMFPPETKDCPPEQSLPSVLKQSVKTNPKDKNSPNQVEAWFRCLATVGASQTQESKFEGGLRSAWLALDPNGPNCPKDAKGNATAACQYKQLVREDAYLIVVVVSDDDDCSVNLAEPMPYATSADKEALKSWLPKEDWERCQALGDPLGANAELSEGNCEVLKYKKLVTKCPRDCRVAGLTAQQRGECEAEVDATRSKWRVMDRGYQNSGRIRFSTVSEFVNKFRTLKSDPGRVLFATITGDSVTDGAGLQDDRVAYYRSLIRNIATGQAPYVCAGARGEAGYGSRYVQVARAFGDNGLVANICKGADFSDALSDISELILTRVVKVCLPHPPNYDEKLGRPILKVVRKRGGKTTELKYTDLALPDSKDPDSYYIKATADCLTTGRVDVAGQSAPCKTTRDCSAGLTCQEGLCKIYSEAIYFSVVPEKGDAIEVNYAADTGL